MRDPRKEWSWVSLKELTCWRTLSKFIIKSQAEFTSSFMASSLSFFFPFFSSTRFACFSFGWKWFFFVLSILLRFSNPKKKLFFFFDRFLLIFDFCMFLFVWLFCYLCRLIITDKVQNPMNITNVRLKGNFKAMRNHINKSSLEDFATKFFFCSNYFTIFMNAFSSKIDVLLMIWFHFW